MKEHNAKQTNIFIISLFVIVLLASYIRIYFGVYFTDESFYIALPYRFILGNLPLKDEYSICQFAGILLYPLYYLYLSIHHSTDAILLFARHLYLLFFSVLTLLCYWTFKQTLGWRLALVTASICLAFNFCNIALLSYNTLAIFFLTCGCLCNFKILQSNSNKLDYFAAGLCFSVATFVYPPLIICGLSSFMILCFKDLRNCFAYFMLGLLPIVILSLSLIHFAGILSLLNTYHYLHDTGYTHRFHNVLYNLYYVWHLYTYGKTTVLLLLMTVLCSNLICLLLKFREAANNVLYLRLKKLSQYCALFIPFTLIAAYLQQLIYRYPHPDNWDYITACYTLLINLCLLAPLYLTVLTNKQLIKTLCLSIGIPSLIAGFITGFFSKNGLPNCMVGLFPALIASSIILGVAGKEIVGQLTTTPLSMRSAKSLPYFIASLLLIILLINKYTFNYQDPPIYQLNQQIKQGPFKYVFTTNAQQQINNQYAQDLQHTNDIYHPGNILIYPGFPAGYLYSALVPATNSVWLFDLTGTEINTTINYLKQSDKQADMVVVMKKDIVHGNNALGNFLNTAQYQLVKSQNNYSIYIRSDLYKRRVV